MKVKNISGLAYHFFPGNVADKLDKTKIEISDKIITNNAIAFFIGAMPSADILYPYDNFDDVVAAYQSKLVFKLDSVDFKYTYNRAKKERIIQKLPVDAVYHTCAVGAEEGSPITWCAVKLQATTPGITDYIVFSNNIGTWDDTNIIAMFENVNAVAGEKVLFKDFTISIRDIHERDV
jgi:hypothetical protein